MDITPVLVTGIIFGFTYAVIHLLVRRKERMALIEKGEDVTVLNNGFKPGVMALKLGLLFIGVAVGLLLGSVLVATTTLNGESAYFSMIFLFGGIGLVLSHFIEKREIQDLKRIME
jgi:hypothetical protein